jgi:hypothetical protein
MVTCLELMYAFNPLMLELNPSAQHLPDEIYLLEILILEPCISLIYV